MLLYILWIIITRLVVCISNLNLPRIIDTIFIPFSIPWRLIRNIYQHDKRCLMQRDDYEIKKSTFKKIVMTSWKNGDFFLFFFIQIIAIKCIKKIAFERFFVDLYLVHFHKSWTFSLLCHFFHFLFFVWNENFFFFLLNWHLSTFAWLDGSIYLTNVTVHEMKVLKEVI